MSFGNNPAGIQRAAVICRGKTTQSISAWTTLTNWTEIQDPTNSFNPITGIFTAPRAGTYDFSLGDGLSQPIGGYYGLSVTKNGTQLYNILHTAQSASIQYDGLSASIELAAGDTLIPRAYHGTPANDATSVSNSWFTITETNTVF